MNAARSDNSGIFLPGVVVRFINVIPCERHDLQALISACLKKGISLSATVTDACDRYDAVCMGHGGDLSCQELTLS